MVRAWSSLTRTAREAAGVAFHRSSLGFSLSLSHTDKWHCYVRPAALQALLETPGAVELLLDLLGSEESASLESGTREQQLRSLRRQAIHLAVRPDSPFCGLSIEEILVLTAYTSDWFDKTTWKREVSRHPDEREIEAACREWVHDRTATIRTGQQLGSQRFRLVGYAFADYVAPEQVVFAIAFCLSAHAMARDLDQLTAEGGFAHELYVACSPATALDYLELSSRSAGGTPRWDASALDRRLRRLGLGLLLVERERVALCMPARRNNSPPALYEALHLLKAAEISER